MMKSTRNNARLNKFRIYLLVFVAVLCALAPNSFADELTDATRASDKARVTIKESINEKDGGLLASLFTDDGAIISANGHSVSGRLKIRMTAAVLLRTGGGGELSALRQSITLVDDEVYETGSYSLSSAGAKSSQKKLFSGHYTIIWRLEEKTWKIHRAIGLF